MEGLRRRAADAKGVLSDIGGAYKELGETAQQDAPTRGNRDINLQNLTQLSEKAGPVFRVIGGVLEQIEPFLEAVSVVVRQIWKVIEPYHPEDLLTAVYGLALVFFGGVFMTLVASFEAAHLFGWDKIRVSTKALYIEWCNTRAAFERDNKIDADYDGVADVNQLSARDLAARRVMVMTKSVDPENISIALEGMTMATVAILATLRVRFAKAITLGTAIGGVLDKFLGPFVTKGLEFAIPGDYEKWIPVLRKYGFRYVGVSASWILMRAMTSMFGAMRGSSLFVTGVCGYLVRHQYVNGSAIFTEGNPLLVGAWGALAVTGWYWQLSSRFRLPFPLNILFFPITVLEHAVMLLVGSKE